MKKIKFLLFILIGIFVLSIDNKVSADDVVGLLECKYELVSGANKIEENFVENNIISFYYTDLEFNNGQGSEEDIVSGKLMIRKNNATTPSFEHVKIFQDNSFYIKEKKGLDMVGGFFYNMQAAFINAAENAEGKNNGCPGSFAIVHFKGNEELDAVFNQSEQYCKVMSEYGNNCVVSGKLRTDLSSKIMVDTERDIWNFTSNGDGACHQLNLDIFVDISNGAPVLKGAISYPEGTLFYPNSAQMRKEVRIKSKEFNYEEYGKPATQFGQIYLLLKENKILTGYVRADSGNEEVVLGKGAVGKSYCSIENKQVTKVANTCLIYSEVHTFIIANESKFKRYVLDPLRDTYESLAVPGRDTLPMYSYWTDINALKEAKQSILSILSQVETAEESSNGAENYKDVLLDLKTQICPNDERTLKMWQKYAESLDNYKGNKEMPGEIDVIITTLEQGLSDIVNRLEELDAITEEEKEEVNDAYEFIEDYYENYVTVATMVSLLDVELTFRRGCDMISYGLYNWLVQLLDIMKISALVLTLVLGMVDFFKGVASGNADTMKKVWKNFSRRLISVVLLFLLPVILEFIFGLVNINGLNSDNPLCGLK